MMAGHEMRRVREMFPSFDTRRVLCKQQRNHCVKPIRAGLKAKNASNAGSVMSEASGQRRYGSSRNIAHCHALTKTRPEGQSTGAWSAMCRLGLGSKRQQGWPGEQVALLAHGERSAGLKHNCHHPTNLRSMTAQNERRKRLLPKSEMRGLKQIGRFAGRNIQNTGMLWRLLFTTKTTNRTRNGQGATPETLGKNGKKTLCGEKREKRKAVAIGCNIQRGAESSIANGGRKTLRHGSGYGKSRLKEEGKTLFSGQWIMSGNGSEKCLRVSGLRAQQSDAVATSLCNTSNQNSPMGCTGTTTEPIGI
jgi:hypothetical protein